MLRFPVWGRRRIPSLSGRMRQKALYFGVPLIMARMGGDMDVSQSVEEQSCDRSSVHRRWRNLLCACQRCSAGRRRYSRGFFCLSYSGRGIGREEAVGITGRIKVRSYVRMDWYGRNTSGIVKAYDYKTGKKKVYDQSGNVCQSICINKGSGDRHRD